MRFHVVRIEPSGLVVGRNDNQDIPLGVTFTHVTKVRCEGDPMNPVTVDTGVVGTVELKLIQIESYGRLHAFVPGGHTAGLRLQGRGMEVLTSVLTGAAPREHVSIAAEPASVGCGSGGDRAERHAPSDARAGGRVTLGPMTRREFRR